MEPSESRALIEKAVRALAENKVSDAQQLCRDVLHAAPEDHEALLLLGISHLQSGDPEQAIQFLHRAVETGPDSAKAALWLARAYRRSGRAQAALESCQRALNIDSEDPAVRFQMGLCLLDVNRPEDSFSHFKVALTKNPRDAAVHHAFGIALKRTGRSSESTLAFTAAWNIDRTSIEIGESLWEALVDENNPRGAAEVAKALLSLRPDADSQYRLATSLLMAGETETARTHAQAAEALGFPPASIAYLYGSMLQTSGQIDEAEAEFRRSIELQPVQGIAYSAFVRNRRMRDEDRPLVARMAQAASNDALSPAETSQIHFALGKSWEDLGDYEEAMRCFDVANRVVKESRPSFDGAAYEGQIESKIAKYQMLAEQMAAFRGSPSDLPIFVVGMLRSGTTLVQQILSSHPRVGAAGEQRFWLSARAAAIGNDPVSFNVDVVRQATERYLSLLAQIAPGKPRVVDKMPDNYLELPLLHAALPKARIIHIKRNPVDTCLSNYTTPNRVPVKWANDKANIVLAYRQYLRLMEHWRKLLPLGAMLEVQYEELVKEPEPTTRRMIQYCGLDWDEACLKPELNRQSISTPNRWQVRQPINNSSVARWRRFEPWLGAFAELLETGAD